MTITVATNYLLYQPNDTMTSIAMIPVSKYPLFLKAETLKQIVLVFPYNTDVSLRRELASSQLAEEQNSKGLAPDC